MSVSEGGSVPVQAARGIVKQILSGDAVVIRGQPRGGPPPTRTVALSNITAPRLARRANPNIEGSSETVDEPYAWEAREFLRKILVGKEVRFVVEHANKASNREYGSIWVAADGRNVTDLLLNEGVVEVRQAGVRPSEELSRLLLLESASKAAEKGKWSKNKTTLRSITWSMTNDELRTFVQRNQGKQLDAVVEYVRDGSTLRCMVIPSYTFITVAMSGIKSPMFKRDGDTETPEPFAEMAKFFTESRLLQQDVKLLIEGVSNQLVMATVIHPMGNIAERLVKEGFARCVDWSMAMVSKDKDKLRAAEKAAKQQQLRIWKGYQPSSSATLSQGSSNFSGKVVEVVNGDALVIKKGDQQYQKIWFSSIRPPRMTPKEGDENGGTTRRQQQQQRIRPLYDIPHMWEAREFLRKKLIGKKVNVKVDYIKPAQDSFPEKTCCTVTREDINIAEALISKGLAYCLRHKQDDDQRSSQYDELMAAEARAIKNGKGVHSKKEPVPHRVAELSTDPTKAKQFLPFLQRAGKTVALVEFIASGSRVRLYLPKDTCLISFLLAGISCPRAPRDDANPGDAYGQQALMYVKDLIMQREVEIEVEACDKGGNFIGWLYSEGKNLSVALLEVRICVRVMVY
jgi:staphylococcal nuclease domain-containing protein 1